MKRIGLAIIIITIVILALVVVPVTAEDNAVSLGTCGTLTNENVTLVITQPDIQTYSYDVQAFYSIEGTPVEWLGYADNVRLTKAIMLDKYPDEMARYYDDYAIYEDWLNQGNWWWLAEVFGVDYAFEGVNFFDLERDEIIVIEIYQGHDDELAERWQFTPYRDNQFFVLRTQLEETGEGIRNDYHGLSVNEQPCQWLVDVKDLEDVGILR